MRTAGQNAGTRRNSIGFARRGDMLEQPAGRHRVADGAPGPRCPDIPSNASGADGMVGSPGSGNEDAIIWQASAVLADPVHAAPNQSSARW